MSTTKVDSLQIMPSTRDYPGLTTVDRTVISPSLTRKEGRMNTATPSEAVTDTRDEQTKQSSSVPLVTIVAILAGVSVLLLILLIGFCAFLSCFAFYKNHKKNSVNTQYDMPMGLSTLERRNRSYNSRLQQQLPDLPPTNIYSEIKDGNEDDLFYTNSGYYDDTCENHYASIPEQYHRAVEGETNESPSRKRSGHSIVTNTMVSPSNTVNKTLYQTIDESMPQQGGNEHNSIAQKVPTFQAVSLRTQSKDSEENIAECDYTDMTGSRDPSLSPACSQTSLPETAGPVLLSKLMWHNKMEDNPTYNSSWSLLGGFENPEEEIYTEPDIKMSENLIYEAIYSDSKVQPSIFTQDSNQNNHHQGAKTEECDLKKPEHETVFYSPIYLSISVSTPLQKKLPEVTNANIRGVQVLGTGFFGKVVLADTVGLSLKDLNLSDEDDDKSTSVRVAVKKLKPNASKTTQEAFEKEYKFMARLNHPNVIRLLGVCTSENSQFLMMEHMERGDLNEYLTKFEKIIISDGIPSEDEILIGTLLYMCSQIASAMNYLVSRNFIHRDLAARNCLVGSDNLIKLADFGMSRSLYESHYYIVRGQAVLPVRWMATECFYGKFSAKTDVWAFGVTMWEIFMLAKDRPYSDMEDMELVNNAIESEERLLLQQPEHCPDDVYKVMMSCWAREAKDRATFEQLHAMLQATL